MYKRLVLLTAAAVLAATTAANATYSVVALDPETGELGVAV